MIPPESVAYLGALLLGAATVPQALTLVTTRRVADFGWSFSVLNFVGLACLAIRSLVIQEWAFLAINVVTTTFWALVVWLKLVAARAALRARQDDDASDFGHTVPPAL